MRWATSLGRSVIAVAAAIYEMGIGLVPKARVGAGTEPEPLSRFADGQDELD